jgi:RNA polymerase sigma-70 factor (ECF subfamily)
MITVSSLDDLNFGVSVAPSQTASEHRSDHLLLAETLSGDESAFAELVGRYRNQITNFVYRMLGDYDTSVDLAQETFVRVYRAADRYKSDFAFSTYIYRIATNLAISEIRKRKRRKLVSLTGFFKETDRDSEREMCPPDLRPLQDSVMVETERRNAVGKAIATLPERYRAPLVLRDVEGKSYVEIAEILQTNEGTIKSRISRARALLREKLVAYM